MHNLYRIIVLIAFSSALLTFLVLFILLAHGEVELNGKAIGALTYVMGQLIRLMAVVIKQLDGPKRS
jgi:hypothetical protein